jgi:hypothetical protein
MSSGKVSNPLAHFRPGGSFLYQTNRKPNGAACGYRIVPLHIQVRFRYAPPWEDSNFDVMKPAWSRHLPAEKIILLERRSGLHHSLQIRIPTKSQRDEF